MSICIFFFGRRPTEEGVLTGCPCGSRGVRSLVSLWSRLWSAWSAWSASGQPLVSQYFATTAQRGIASPALQLPWPSLCCHPCPRKALSGQLVSLFFKLFKKYKK
jgi:hypothetical protein